MLRHLFEFMWVPRSNSSQSTQSQASVTWCDLNPEPWQITIKDYSPLMCLYPRYLCLASWKQNYFGDFTSSIILFPVSQTHTVSKWFLSDCSCVQLLSSLKSATFCVCFNLSLQCGLLRRGLQRSEWCSWRLCCDLCCCGFHRNETTVGRRQSGRRKMTSPSPTHSDSSGSSKHDSNQVCGNFNVQSVSFCSRFSMLYFLSVNISWPQISCTEMHHAAWQAWGYGSYHYCVCACCQDQTVETDLISSGCSLWPNI